MKLFLYESDLIVQRHQDASETFRLIHNRMLKTKRPVFLCHKVMANKLMPMLQASIWMIDFEKTYETTPGVRSDSRDDGYLTGLDSAIDLLSNLILPAAKPSSE